MKYFWKQVSFILILSTSILLFLLSCSKKKESNSSSSNSSSSTVTCASRRTLVASTQAPLLVVRVQYADATFQSSETTWADKMFGTSDGQMNHYLNETTYSKYQFTPATETYGCTNDGVVTVSMTENHPDTQSDSWACYAATAITAADSSVNFAAYDTDSNGKLSVNELQVIFLVAGGESASYCYPSCSPGGVWGMATELLCDANGDGVFSDESGEHGVTLDNVRLLGLTSSTYGQNGYSQFGERQGSSSTNTWDATIGVMAHELGHAYFDLPDLYCAGIYTDNVTKWSTICSGIGNFGLMGGGSWGYKSTSEKAGATPVHLSAWSKENLNICTPQTVSSGTNSVTLPAVHQSSTHAASCGIYKASTSTSGEYFLFENRSPGGYDEGLYYSINWGGTDLVPGSSTYFTGGIAIWHVKDILDSCSDNNTCETQSPPLIDLEEVNNADLDSALSNGRTTHLFYSGNSVTFNNSSTPNSKLYDNSSCGISATNISVAGDSMTLTISK